MEIKNVDWDNKRVTLLLSSDELVALCNSLYRDKERKPNTDRLYADLMMARDLSQYGHVDGWCLAKIVEQRKEEVQKHMKD